MRSSSPMPLAYLLHIGAHFAYVGDGVDVEIFKARKELAACLISSAELISVMMMGALNGV